MYDMKNPRQLKGLTLTGTKERIWQYLLIIDYRALESHTLLTKRLPISRMQDIGNLNRRQEILNFPDSIVSPSIRFLYRNRVFLVC